jgi:lipopolysaccharide/colanic/teichoic acid biosynthesis glycosyltransferase
MFNWLVALGLLVVFSVPMLLISIAIKLTSRGPVLYIQERVGYKGRIFRIYKFRSMYHDVEVDETWSMANDPRITSIGKFLRRTRLDELPQLANVLVGHMNVVGPRPEQPKIANKLRKTLQGYDDRHNTLPGITGLSQIKLPYDKTISDVRRKLVVDKEYIKTQSVINDLKIMCKTPSTMFRIK